MARIAGAVAHVIDVERAPTINVLGATIQYLTISDDNAPCIMRGTIPPGLAVPLHSHDDPETFLAVAGELEGLSYAADGFRWIAIRPGDIFNVPGGARHAFRNTGREPAVSIVISTAKIGRFFQEFGVPVTPGMAPHVAPSAEQIERFLDASARYGYWNAGPEENARIGIALPGV